MSDETDPTSRDEQTIAIVGVGLIGGSIAAALKKRGSTGTIIGVGRTPSRLEAARAAGLIDECSTDPADAASRSDFVVFCTPPDLIVAGVHAAAAHCRKGTLITDAGSVKEEICRKLAGTLPEGVAFVGSHPLAGSEKQGFEHADADLFDGRVTAVTPTETTPAEALDRVKRFWRSLGCVVCELSPAEHDRSLAQTSHLPHVVAATLAATLTESNHFLAASGFRDTTRIASGDPRLWTSILLANAGEVAGGLDVFHHKLAEFRDAIARRDEAVLKNLLEAAKTNRDKLAVWRE